MEVEHHESIAKEQLKRLGAEAFAPVFRLADADGEGGRAVIPFNVEKRAKPDQSVVGNRPDAKGNAGSVRVGFPCSEAVSGNRAGKIRIDQARVKIVLSPRRHDRGVIGTASGQADFGTMKKPLFDQ